MYESLADFQIKREEEIAKESLMPCVILELKEWSALDSSSKCIILLDGKFDL